MMVESGHIPLHDGREKVTCEGIGPTIDEDEKSHTPQRNDHRQ